MSSGVKINNSYQTVSLFSYLSSGCNRRKLVNELETNKMEGSLLLAVLSIYP